MNKRLLTIAMLATGCFGQVINTGAGAKADIILGPMIPISQSPLASYTINAPAMADSFVTAFTSVPPVLGTQATGTVSIDRDPSCIGNLRLLGAGTVFTSAPPAGFNGTNKIIVAWNPGHGDANGSGRMSTAPFSVIDDNHACLTGTFNSSYDFMVGQSGLNIYQVAPNSGNYVGDYWFIGAAAPIFAYSFYAPELWLDRMSYITATPSYLTNAQLAEDYCWQFCIDHGRSILGGLNLTLGGQFLRAAELYTATSGATDRFFGLYNLVTAASALFSPTSVGQLTNGLIDTRNGGNVLGDIAMGALLDPDTMRHPQWCSLLKTVAGYWSDPAALSTDGSGYNFWQEDIFKQTQNYPTLGIGNSPWRIQLPIMGEMLTSDVFTYFNAFPSDACYSPTLATAAKTAALANLDWANNVGLGTAGLTSPRVGSWYDAGYLTQTQASSTPTGTQFQFRLGSNIVTGVGSTFTAAPVIGGGGGFGGPGVKYILAKDTATGYQVSSVTDDTHIVIAANFGTQGETMDLNANAGRVVEAPAASTTCTGSAALRCANGVPDPNLTRFFTGTNGRAFSWSNQTATQYKTFGAKAFNTAVGSPDTGSGGAGGCSSVLAGINCTPTVTDWIAELIRWCTTDPTVPCQQFGGANYIYTNAFKNGSELNGVMNGDRFLADILPGSNGTAASGNVTVSGNVTRP